METDNTVYQQIKKSQVLKGQKLQFLNYLSMFGPCSTNELIEEVRKNGLMKPRDLSKLNRHPAPLKRQGFIEVHSKRKCRAGSSGKEVEVLQISSKVPEVKKIARGKTLRILESSINAALLAVENYNKPRAPFKTENYISLMINAWTKAFHAYYRLNFSERKYLYPKKDGETKRRTWDLLECIKKFDGNIADPVKANLMMFIDLRNEVVHGLVDESQVDASIFGECQALLYNYENFIIKNFGSEYSLCASLSYSLQFSTIRKTQKEVMNAALSSEGNEVVKFLKKYRGKLDDHIWNSPEFSIRLIQIPKISNTKKSDLAMEFVRFDELSREDKEYYEKVTTIIKDHNVNVANLNLHKPGEVLKKVNSSIPIATNHHYLNHLYKIFQIKEKTVEAKIPRTNTKFCVYDKPNESFLYTETWISFCIKLFTNYSFSNEKIKVLDKQGKKLDWKDYK